MASNNDSIQKTLIVALLLCLTCSIMVSTTAVVLKPKKAFNKQQDMKKNILVAAGLMEEGKSIDELFSQIEVKAIDFETGEEDPNTDVEKFDQKKATKDPQTSIEIPADKDVGGMKRRSKIGLVYLVTNGEQYESVIIPVAAKGLWSTMYGFLALDIKDLSTVKGFAFYSHGETPGLGGEVDNPKWKAQWKGKKVFDEQGAVKARLAKGRANPSDPHSVDGLSGATITANGITNMFRYWLSEHAYGRYLSRLKLKTGGLLWDGINRTYSNEREFINDRPK